MTLDVQTDLAAEMARELEIEGTCVRLVPAIPPQAAVDVSWAAKRAGRMIGRRVRTSVSPVSPRPDGDLAVIAIAEPRSPSEH